MVASDGIRDAGVARDAGAIGAPGRRSPGSAAPRSCARPGCPGGAEATLRFDYGERAAVIEPLEDERPPQTYDLCRPHATRTRPPHGWTLHVLLPTAPSPDARSAPTPGAGRGRDTLERLAAAFNAAANDVARDPARSSLA